MVKQGYKQTELGLLPGDWKVVPFHECFDIMPNNTFSRAELSNEGNVKNIHYGDILIQYNEIVDCESNDIPYLTEQAEIKAKHAFLENGDVVIADTAEDETVGKAVEITNADKPIVSGLHTIPCRPKFYDFASKWLGYYMNSQLYHKQLLPYITGTKVSAISKQSIKDTLIVIPPFEQQEKYVEYLSAIDELISNQEKLIEKKKAIKQGVMQELLTGKKRLNGFDNKWTKYPLSFWFDYFKGNGLSKEKLHSNGKHDCILYGELFTQYSEIINDVVSKTNNEEGVLSQKYDVLFPCSTTTNGRDLATASVIMKDNVLLGGDIGIYRRKQDIDTRFFGYLVPSLVDEIIKYTQGLTIVHLKAEEMLKMEVLMPSDVKEQTAIADVLADMDSEVFELEQKLEKYKQLKQAMLEQLLTGKIRLI